MPNAEIKKITLHSSFIIRCSIFIIVFSSCNYFKKNNDENAVARVDDQYLYKSELNAALPGNLNAEDSTRLAANFINNWIKEQLILKKAELNLPEEKKDVEKQMQEYRNSLLIYLYKEELVKQRLDTVVKQNEIESYYNENKQNFALKENIIRAVYVKLDKQNKSVNKIKKWLNDADADNKNKLAEYCSTQALRFSLDEHKWQTPEDLARETGIEQRSIEQMARNLTTYELYENDGYYIVKMLEYQLKDNISPLTFEAQNIRNILLNKRKLQLIEQMEKDIYKEALAKNNFEIYSIKN